MLAWLPDQLIYGKPRILDVVVVSGASVAKARDDHYHNPPDYIVLEPEDTSTRTANLQQTNTNGHKWQGTPEQFIQAQALVRSWGRSGTKYKPTAEYQRKLRDLLNRFPYRLDTNYAKMDRIVHPEVETFKTRVMQKLANGMTIGEWCRTFASGDEVRIREALEEHLAITEGDAEKLRK